MKTLKQILEVYSPKSADEKRFVKKHITVKTPDPAGNNDDVYQATNIKTIDRAKEKKGYDAKASEAVYEGAEEFKDINDPLIEEMLNEVLAKDAKAADYISDFVKSDNPKFAGKSKAKRIQMALGAYYSKQRGE